MPITIISTINTNHNIEHVHVYVLKSMQNLHKIKLV